jgi:ParB-like chromosome segregation protein Spo0J
MAKRGTTPPKQADFKIDEEFERLLPPLLPEEYEGLKNNIAKAGTCDPLTVWKETGILIDGHHRRKICEELGIKPPINKLSFASREEVVAWMLDYQRSRRNMNKFRWAEAALNQKERIALQAKDKQRTGGKALFQNSGKVHTDKILAKRAGISHDTLNKVAYILHNASKKTIEALRRGDAGVSVNSVYTELRDQECEMEKAVKFTPKAKKRSNRQNNRILPKATKQPTQKELDHEINSVIESFMEIEERLPIDCLHFYVEIERWVGKRKTELAVALVSK